MRKNNHNKTSELPKFQIIYYLLYQIRKTQGKRLCIVFLIPFILPQLLSLVK